MLVTLTVLFGGRGDEYAVSLRSAAAVLRAATLPCRAVGITRDGRFLETDPDACAILRDAWQDAAAPWSPASLDADGVVFPLLHGRHGEDGELQGYLSTLDIPYIGCTTLAGAIGMDKYMAKLLASSIGIPTLLQTLVYKNELSDPLLYERIEAALFYPIFVKPSDGGSSIGAGIARDRAELRRRLAQADTARILLEPYQPAREIEVAILEERGVLTLPPPGEVGHTAEFYDYDTKYGAHTPPLSIPAALPRATAELVTDYAKRIFLLFGCRHLARVDFFVSERGVFFNEINTMPGFTAGSMYPRLFEAIGIPMDALILRLCAAARP
ncbi:MAG: D-alanine--D-alanine ligase [Clostridia bacterium]|nr:D-alanine--D-alanine ligase [Clostridia bacterium]